MNSRNLQMVEFEFELDPIKFYKVGDYRWKHQDHLCDEEREDIGSRTQILSMIHVLNGMILQNHTPVVSINQDFAAVFDLEDDEWLEKDLFAFCREVEIWLDGVKTLRFNKNQDIILPKQIERFIKGKI